MKTDKQKIAESEQRLAEIDRIESEGKTSRKLKHERSRHQIRLHELREAQPA